MFSHESVILSGGCASIWVASVGGGGISRGSILLGWRWMHPPPPHPTRQTVNRRVAHRNVVCCMYCYCCIGTEDSKVIIFPVVTADIQSMGKDASPSGCSTPAPQIGSYWNGYLSFLFLLFSRTKKHTLFRLRMFSTIVIIAGSGGGGAVVHWARASTPAPSDQFFLNFMFFCGGGGREKYWVNFPF